MKKVIISTICLLLFILIAYLFYMDRPSHSSYVAKAKSIVEDNLDEGNEHKNNFEIERVEETDGFVWYRYISGDSVGAMNKDKKLIIQPRKCYIYVDHNNQFRVESYIGDVKVIGLYRLDGNQIIDENELFTNIEMVKLDEHKSYYSVGIKYGNSELYGVYNKWGNVVIQPISDLPFEYRGLEEDKEDYSSEMFVGTIGPNDYYTYIYLDSDGARRSYGKPNEILRYERALKYIGDEMKSIEFGEEKILAVFDHFCFINSLRCPIDNNYSTIVYYNKIADYRLSFALNMETMYEECNKEECSYESILKSDDVKYEMSNNIENAKKRLSNLRQMIRNNHYDNHKETSSESLSTKQDLNSQELPHLSMPDNRIIQQNINVSDLNDVNDNIEVKQTSRKICYSCRRNPGVCSPCEGTGKTKDWYNKSTNQWIMRTCPVCKGSRICIGCQGDGYVD